MILLCKHCGARIMPGVDDWWFHVTADDQPGLMRCQSPGVAYGHLAEPVGQRCRADGPLTCLGAARS